MSRTVTEWIGANDDAVPPPRVRVRVFDRCGGKCGLCKRRIRAGERWTLEHVTALINGGENRESNLGVTCCNCVAEKNAADVAVKSDTYDMRRKSILPGRQTKTRPMDGSRASGWKKPMHGPAVRR